MIRVLLVVLLLAWVVGLVLWFAMRRTRTGLPAAERRELEASRALIAQLLAEAVDVRDVDPVLSPKVIDAIRAHQRSLAAGPDDQR